MQLARQARALEDRGLLGPLPLDDLTELAPDRAHRGQLFPVRGPHAAGKELHDTEGFAAEQNGERRRGTESCPGRECRSYKTRVFRGIPDPGCFAALPDLPEHAAAAREGCFTTGLVELPREHVRPVPDALATQ